MTKNRTFALEQLENEALSDSVKSLWNTKPEFLILTQRFFTSLKNTLKVSVLSLMLLTAFVIKPDVAFASGFNQTCSNVKVNGDKTHVYLSATCLKKNGQKADSRLEISKYIANHNGELVWAPREGGFIKSCADTIYFGDGQLQADYCESVANGTLYASIFDLNAHISNQDGVLTPDL